MGIGMLRWRKRSWMMRIWLRKALLAGDPHTAAEQRTLAEPALWKKDVDMWK